VKPTRQPGEKNKQALRQKVVFACCMDVKQQRFDLLHLSRKEFLNKEYEYEIITRIIDSGTRPLQSQHN
jgi:hypothetical protein